MGAVEWYLIIPAMPLAAFLVILFVTRPLELAAKRRAERAAGGASPQGTAHGASGHDAHGDQEVDHLASAAAHEDDHGGHGAHPPTPFWAQVSGWIAFLALFVSFLFAIAILFQFIGDPALQSHGYNPAPLYQWFSFGPLKYPIQFRVDTLTAVMLVVVTTVSMLVHLYSMGYMQGDPGYSRFFIELGIFTLSMLILVLAANFLVIFIGWELVGLSSYLLIGFWYDRTDPPPAALKAFVTTRLGDFGFTIGILLLFVATGTFNFVELNSATLHTNQFIVTAAMILVFCGAVGKSAQFPLHVWLPDAMEGPTPVSALIHAATMVAAGVYLVARLFPIYAHAADPTSLAVVGYVGGFTALLAASIALVQNDIKRVLAYSTVSQLGYMFVGLSVAETNGVGMFHLYTHAFFKALLFLGSGSVIHAVANQDMRSMGGLFKRMPVTAITFLLATLSISGFPGLAGFFSKDLIISTAYDFGTKGHVGGYILYGVTLFTAFLTAFYMFRLYYLTFGGRGASLFGLRGGDEHFRGEQRAHESPWTMTLPLLTLAVPAVLAGYWFGFQSFVNNGHEVVFENPFTVTNTYIGIGAGLLGILLAGSMYGARRGISPNWYAYIPGGKAIYTLLLHKYYLDELYLWLIRLVILGLSSLAAWFDLHIIDGIVNGTAAAVRGFGNVTSRTETGKVQNYGAVFFAGAVIIAIALFIAVAYPGLLGK
jgi:NADH-quinone oxidoreductase subunit L